MMKMKIVFACVILLFTITAGTYAASSNEQYKGYSVVHVMVNGKNVRGEVPGINMDGTTLVPLRLVSETLGADVQWDGQTSTASIQLAKSEAAELTPEQALKQQMIHLYSEILEHADNLEDYREKIRIAKEYYDVRKEDHYLKRIKTDGFADTDQWLNQAILSVSELTMKAKDTPMDATRMNKALSLYTESLNAYKSALDNLQLYLNEKQDFYLNFYTIQYTDAYFKESEMKSLVKKELNQLKN
jgi:hypothetical protein